MIRHKASKSAPSIPLRAAIPPLERARGGISLSRKDPNDFTQERAGNLRCADQPRRNREEAHTKNLQNAPQIVSNNSFQTFIGPNVSRETFSRHFASRKQENPPDPAISGTFVFATSAKSMETILFFYNVPRRQKRTPLRAAFCRYFV